MKDIPPARLPNVGGATLEMLAVSLGLVAATALPGCATGRRAGGQDSESAVSPKRCRELQPVSVGKLLSAPQRRLPEGNCRINKCEQLPLVWGACQEAAAAPRAVIQRVHQIFVRSLTPDAVAGAL